MDNSNKKRESFEEMLINAGISEVSTMEEYVDYLIRYERMHDQPVFPVDSDYQDYGIVNTEGKIGALDPVPNADLPLRKGVKIHIYNKI